MNVPEVAPAAFLASLRDMGLTLRADGARLLVSPKELLTPSLRLLIGKKKPGLLAVLAEEDGRPFG